MRARACVCVFVQAYVHACLCESLADPAVEFSDMIPAMKRLTRGESSGIWVAEEEGIPLIVGSYKSEVLV